LSSQDASKITKNILKIGQECLKEIGASAADVTAIMQKKVPTTKEGKCLIFCVHQKIGFQQSSGKTNLPGIEGWINEMKSLDKGLGDKMQQIADNCISSVDDSGDGCEVASVSFGCYVAKAKEVNSYTYIYT
ncbi:hypothetical protein ILUMI_14802, partial [Ignelater luminosus]